jgi:recombination protein RecR
MANSERIEQAVEQLASLPTIGRKTARRLAFHLLRLPEEHVQRFAETIIAMRREVQECSICCTFTDTTTCPTCANPKRNVLQICVVEQPSDVLAIERTGDYRGVYHVLHGALNPLDGVGVTDIRMRELFARLESNIEEVILAVNPTVEGELTTQYIVKMTQPLTIPITRIARGIPVGADLEFTDEATLSRAFIGRQPV